MKPEKPTNEGQDCGCGPSGSCGPTRRQFLGGAALLTIGALSAGIFPKHGKIYAGPFEGVGRADSLIPADKMLHPEWVRSLTARGQRSTYRGADTAKIGMPIGGIGAGQVYLGGDGTLKQWDIFNGPPMPQYDYVNQPGPVSPVDQGFAVRITAKSGQTVVPLDHRGFADIAFTGEYPIGFVEYRDPALPIQVSLEAYSPFVPLDPETSAMPATIFDYTVKNTSSEPVTVEIAGWMQNAALLQNGYRWVGLRRNMIARDASRAMLQCVAEETKVTGERHTVVFADFEGASYDPWTVEGTAFGSGPARGPGRPDQNLSGFRGKGLANSYTGDDLTGKLTSPDFTIELPYINFLIAGGNHPGETCINLVIDGTVVRTETGRDSDALVGSTWNVTDLVGKKAHIEIVDSNTGAWGHIDVDQIEFSNQPGLAEPPRKTIVYADFEGASYDPWKVEGDAFGSGPAHGPGRPEQNLSGFVGKGLANSYLGDDLTGKLTSPDFTIELPYINFLIAGGNHPGETCMNLVIDGAVARTETGNNTDTLAAATWDVTDLVGKKAHIEIVDSNTGAWGHIDVDQIEFSDQPGLAHPPVDLITDAPDFGSMGLTLMGAEPDDQFCAALPEGALPASLFGPEGLAPSGEASVSLDQRLIGALGRKMSLMPGGEKKVTFIVSWYFPNLKLAGVVDGAGRHYGTVFASGAALADTVASNLPRLRDQTRLWHDTWYESTLPYWFLDRTFANTTTLATQTCYWLASGRFYGWEGVGCCPGTCTHVYHYAQAMGRLFPQLERDTRERVDFGIGFYPDSGVIDHRAEFHAGPAVDGQAGTILRAYREHRTSVDTKFLERNWPKIKMALRQLISQDRDSDGMLQGAQHNTLDTEWYGEVPWLSSLYIAALRAGEVMAREMGDTQFAATTGTLAAKGTQTLVAHLWNGEYFIQRLDPQHLDAISSGDGCEIDQVFGQSWAFQVGLPRVVDSPHAKAALAALWKYNFASDVGPYRQVNTSGRWYAVAGEGGLIMCTYPKKQRQELKGDSTIIGYFNECMSGFEHQVAGHMLWEGMLTEGLAIERAIHDRYHPSRRNPWNEIECGDHYARAMASYGVFLAACGFSYDGPGGHIGFDPKLSPDDFKAAFTAAEGWGSYAQQRTATQLVADLHVKHGSVRLRSVSLTPQGAEGDAANAVATLNGHAVPAKVLAANGRVTVAFAGDLVVKAGSALRIRVGTA